MEEGLIRQLGRRQITPHDAGNHWCAAVRPRLDIVRRVVEDVATAYWPEFGGGLRREGTFIERCKTYVDELNAPSSNAMAETDFGRSTFFISFHDLVVAIKKAPFVNRELLMLPQPAGVRA